MRGNKRRNVSGFTLTEALTAIIVLGLLCAALGAVIPATVTAYQNNVKKSEAAVLCSTVAEAVSNELRFADDAVDNGTEVTYTSRRYGVGSSISSENGRVAVNGTSLLGEKAYTSKLKASVSVAYAAGKFNITVTVTDASGAQLAREAFSVAEVNG